MDMIETTISEHIFNQGQAEGYAKGIMELLTMLEGLYQQGILSEAQMKPLAIPLRQKLEGLRG